MFKYKKDALEYVGGLSKPEKMPCPAFSLKPIVCCPMGKILCGRENSVCRVCYGTAKSSRYVRFAGCMNNVWEKRLAATQKPYFVDAMVRLLKDEEYFRWHDTGDVYSRAYWEQILRICEQTPDTLHRLPTKEYWIATQEWPENLCVRFSLPYLDAPEWQVKASVKAWGCVSTVSTTDDDPNRCRMVKKLSRDGIHYVSFCGDCRRCWDNNDLIVDYEAHSLSH